MHDEAHDGSKVVSMEGHLGLFTHMHSTGVPRSLAVTKTLHPLPTVGRLEGISTVGETEEKKIE